MAKKINFVLDNIVEETRKQFMLFDEADKKLVALAAEYKAARAVLTNGQESALKAVDEAKTQADKAEARKNLETILVAISKLDNEYKNSEERKLLRRDKKTALAILPDGLYDAYVVAFETGADGKLGQAMQDALLAWGFEEAKNTSALRRFASTLKSRISGGRKASAKIRNEEGVRLTVKGSAMFKEQVMLALLDMLGVSASASTEEE